MDDEDKYAVTDDQRRANVLKLRKLIWDIQQTQAKKRPAVLQWKQAHNPVELLEALETFRDGE